MGENTEVKAETIIQNNAHIYVISMDKYGLTKANAENTLSQMTCSILALVLTP